MRLRRVACPLPVLPPLTCDTVQAVLEGHFGQVLSVARPVDSSTHRDALATIQLVRAEGLMEPESVGLVRQVGVGVGRREAGVQGLSPVLQARWNFRSGGVRGDQVAALVNWAAAGGSDEDAAERYELLLQYAADPCGLIAARGLPIAPYLEQAVRMQRGQIDAALAVDPGSDVVAYQQRLALLTRLAEGDVQHRTKYLVLAADQMDRVPWLSDLTGVEARLMRGADWSLYREVQSSAGLHAVTPTSWSPESPGLRVRCELFSQPEPADCLLAGSTRLRLRLSATQNTVTQITLVRPQLSYLRPTPVSVVWQVNDQPVQRTVLDQPHQAHPLRVTLPAGDHRVELQLENPLAGQFVLVRLHEIGSANQSQPWCSSPMCRLRSGSTTSPPPISRCNFAWPVRHGFAWMSWLGLPCGRGTSTCSTASSGSIFRRPPARSWHCSGSLNCTGAARRLCPCAAAGHRASGGAAGLAGPVAVGIAAAGGGRRPGVVRRSGSRMG